MKAPFLMLLVAAGFLTALLPARAADLCLAVLDYHSIASREEVAAAVTSLNVARLGNSNTVNSREKSLKGGDVLYFTRVPASTGHQTTRLGVQKADLDYSVKAGTVSAKITIEMGTKIPSGQVGTFTNEGSAPAGGGQAVLLDYKARAQENTLRSHGNSRTVRSKSMRIMVAELVP